MLPVAHFLPSCHPYEMIGLTDESKFGRDCRYGDIPSPWWQATTVLVGLGSGLALLLAVTATAACCIAYLIHGRMAKIVGVFQFFSGEQNN